MFSKLLKKTSILIYFRFPQYIWAKKICYIINEKVELKEFDLFDAPCGDGIVSYWVNKSHQGKNFILCDISRDKITAAKKYLAEKNMEIYEGDIFDIDLKNNSYIWLLINSVYLIQNIDVLINKLSGYCPYIIAIFPHIDHENYSYFKKKNPEFVNHYEMNVDETIRFFSKNDYEVIYKEDLISIPFHKYSSNPAIKFFWGMIFNCVDRFIKNKNKAYWIAVFKRVF